MSPEDALEGFYDALLDDDPEALYQRAPCGYLSTTPDGTIVKVNQTFLTWSGYQRSDLVGRRTFAQLLTGGGRIYHETHYAPLLRMQGRVREIALDIVTPDGRRLPALVNSVLERDDAGQPRIVRTAVFDASERRQYEQELLRAKQRAQESEERARLLARTLQQSLIPPAPPDIPGLQVSAAYRPAGNGDEIGGDFYDVFQLGPGEWMVAVGDVRGKGVEAAVVTSLVRHTTRAAAVGHPQPSRVLEMLNEVLVRYGTDRFCTLVLLRLRREAGRWIATVALGGHPPPLLARRGADPVEVGTPGVVIGVFDQAKVTDVDVPLEPADLVLLYTDGVTEARGGDSWFGEDRLREAMSRHGATAATLTSGVLDEVLSFQSGFGRDDVVLLALGVPSDDGDRVPLRSVPQDTSGGCPSPPFAS